MNDSLIIIAIASIFIFIAIYRLVNRKQGLIKSPGTFGKPSKHYANIEQTLTILRDDFQLNIEGISRYIGSLYPSLKKEFEVNLQNGLSQYANHHWQIHELTETYIPKLVHQVIVDCTGFSVPRNFDGETFTTQFNQTFEAKDQPFRVNLDWPEGKRIFQFFENDTLLSERNSLPDSRESLILDIEAVTDEALLKHNLEMVNCTNPESLKFQFAFLPEGLQQKIKQKYGKEKAKQFFEGLEAEAETSEANV